VKPLAVNIEVGEHITTRLFGHTVNIDTIWSTAVAGAIVLGLGLYMASRARSGVPSKLQLAFETVVEAVEGQVQQSLGPVAPFVVPLAVTLFIFILISNWLSIIPSGHHPERLPPPTADVNLTAAMALLVIGSAIVTGIRHRGFGGWLKGYLKPFPVLLPINVLEEIAKPVSLALRLFGNLFAGGVMLLIIGLIPWFVMWPFNGLWKAFDLFIGAVQAFIFSLLAILYFGFETAGH
jgi:F-type H+-transporting ATPase subunit a